MFFRLLATAWLILSFVAQAELTATFTQGKSSDTRLDRLPAIALAKSETPTPFLKSGAFSVTWTGELTIEKRSRLFFSFAGKGKASLRIDGKDILTETGTLGKTESKRLRLNPGQHPIEVTYTVDSDQLAEFRVIWRGRDFPKETMPSKAFASQQLVSPLRHGRQLFATHSCTQCHQIDSPITAKSMPELSQGAPHISTIGSRVTEAWLVRWISAPSILKPTTTMPAMVDHRTSKGAQQAADMASYLSSLKSPKPVEPLKKENIKLGSQLFHSLGCISCHNSPEQHEADREHKRIPLNNVDSKYQNGALRDFLLTPRQHWNAIKMPDFRLSSDEAAALASFLRKTSQGHHTPDPSEFPPGNIARGKSLVESVGCASCHNELGPSSLQAPPLAKFDSQAKGCLSSSHTGHKAPELNLTSDEQKSLLTYTKHLQSFGLDSLHQVTASEYTQRQFQTLRCSACHTRDDQAPLLSKVHVESKRLVQHDGKADERLDQSLPILSYTGEKLHSSYISSMLNGTNSYTSRPWLEMRMPSFSANADLMAKGFAHQHGLSVSQAPEKPQAGTHSDIGKQLISLQGGFACTTCHGVENEAPAAAFEVAGINFNQTRTRLRHDYFMRWMNNPQRINPTSKMPRYTSDDGKSPLSHILEGKSEAQFEAIWDYLQGAQASPKN